MSTEFVTTEFISIAITDRFLRENADRLRAAKVDSARLEVDLILADVLNISRSQIYGLKNAQLNSKQFLKFQNSIQRRASGEPLAYIIGKKEFYGMEFRVNQAVLIPRPETELLIDTAASYIKSVKANLKDFKVLDIGTGSGCIAVTIANLFPDVTIEAWDVSKDALTIAKSNAEHNKAKIDFKIQDALDSQSFSNINDYDLILSNPPYIRHDEEADLSPTVKKFEPHLALFEPSKLGFYKSYAENIPRFLKPGKSLKLICEISSVHGDLMQPLFTSAGWSNISIIKDLSGMPRVLTAELNKGHYA